MTAVAAEPTDPDSPVGRADPADPTGRPRATGRGRLVLARLLAARGAVAGAVLILLLFALAFGGPYLTPWDYAAPDFSALHQPPSAEHWFGTNGVGQDVFAQTVRGLQKSLIIGLLVALFSTVLASVVGACAGYFGGWADRALMFLVDLLLVFPSFLIITIVSSRLKSAGWIAFVLLLALFNWMITARVVRSMTLSLREREFVRAARFMGVRPLRIISRHILPNVASFLIIDATIAVGGAVMSETALSYFGFGVKAPDVSLGTLLAAGTSEAPVFPWMFYFAAGLLVLFVLAVNLVGDGLRDALDPTAGGAPRRSRRSPRSRRSWRKQK
ncbi:ABC transporter permease [Kitasatospora aureofaciens]|uniref:Oligopeptide transport system permease protein OppC n=1 Tax=Kitasatospora aureofaciens TaxID=1894 RepID=A0A1E7NC14_KITAU|nr:ABC transporter permease [Kitasatospora aureofaciens]QEV01515.1 ABC transporter permease [Streptomyces viridifaciens]ARF80263.1 peptide ABC transporter permease [Kitasatospora aureofaciens]OEV38227.1 peptide ABC transporter permease [Kitasatospora aureofaciens]UKZ07920.1 ABC transporter permease [Streptomyces viridifaciens]GGU98044.1 ABC transporter permease [Kitasatospora aureofaciens]